MKYRIFAAGAYYAFRAAFMTILLSAIFFACWQIAGAPDFGAPSIQQIAGNLMQDAPFVGKIINGAIGFTDISPAISSAPVLREITFTLILAGLMKLITTIDGIAQTWLKAFAMQIPGALRVCIDFIPQFMKVVVAIISAHLLSDEVQRLMGRFDPVWWSIILIAVIIAAVIIIVRRSLKHSVKKAFVFALDLLVVVLSYLTVYSAEYLSSVQFAFTQPLDVIALVSLIGSVLAITIIGAYAFSGAYNE